MQSGEYTDDPQLLRYGMGTTGQGDRRRNFRERGNGNGRASLGVRCGTSNVNVNLEIRDWWTGIKMAIWE